jgi:hypothetical protein
MELTFLENVHPPLVLHVTCLVSCVMCLVSPVTCHMHMSFYLNGRARRWRVFYQQGLPHLVYITLSEHFVRNGVQQRYIFENFRFH